MSDCLQRIRELKELTMRKLSTTVEDEQSEKKRMEELHSKGADAEEEQETLSLQVRVTRRKGERGAREREREREREGKSEGRHTAPAM